MRDIMLQRVKYFAEQKEQLEKNLSDFFKDKTYSLDDRWSVFEASVHEGVFDNIHSWIWHSKVIEQELNLEWYDDLYTEKYQTRYFLEVIEMLEEREIDGEPITKEQLDAVKEEMLESGYTGFIFDW